MSLYMDTAATTPLCQAAAQAMAPYVQANQGDFGNPSSMHSAGTAARLAVSRARATMADCLHAPTPESIIFTSTATEANNWVLRGLAGRWYHQHPGIKGHVVISAIEHDAVRLPVLWLAEHWGWVVTEVPVSPTGHINVDAFAKAVAQPNTVLASVMMVNNELGTIQPVAELAALAKQHGVPFHTDAVQAVGKLPVDVSALADAGVGYLTWSGHKFYGPKGTGGLFLASHASSSLSPQLLGGGQEQGLRSGTENVMGLAGMAAALQHQTQHHLAYHQHLTALEETFVAAVQTAVAPLPATVMVNGGAPKAPGVVHVSVVPNDDAQPLEGEALVLQLDLLGIQASSGSACHSKVLEPSRVVRVLLGNPTTMAGDDLARAMATVRFSFGWHTTTDDVTKAANALATAASRLLGVPLPAAPTPVT